MKTLITLSLLALLALSTGCKPRIKVTPRVRPAVSRITTRVNRSRFGRPMVSRTAIRHAHDEDRRRAR
jgi:hypothetical protein